ncbi:MAG: EAL domain-containing protein [Gammaproteobacteria bacterium]|nr:EAL domain-containing protein [Gammaproteobacteria bacterium]
MSFRLKTILGITLIQAVMLFILILSSMNLLRSSNQDELQKRAQTAAQLFASVTQSAVLSSDLASLDSFVKEVLTNPGIVYARVLDRRNVVLAQGGDPQALKRLFHPHQIFDDITDAILDAQADIVIEKIHYGRVEIGISTDTISAVLAAARERTTAIAIVELLVVGLFSFFLGLYLTRGLDALKQATLKISQGELGYEVEVRGHDELAQTAHAFNEMSKELRVLYDQRKRAEEELSKLNEDLERRVNLRTEQLTAAYQKIEHQALHDSLTKLPNRTLFQDRLQQTLLTGQRENRPFALVMMDLNKFKTINDTLGHHSGDLVLQETASRLRGILRQSDTIARLGGDEFAMILPTVKDMPAAATAANKIIDTINKGMELEGQTLNIGTSLGIALYPRDGNDAGLLMRHADIAMYAAKRSKSGFMLYSEDLDQSSSGQINLQKDLTRAITENQLVLHYQPKIDFASERVSGVEALVRWQHPEHGLMFPGDFLQLAEDSGLIKPMTRWILLTALNQCKKWHEEGRDLTISVNVSSASLQDVQFPNDVAAVLNEVGASPAWLELELSELGIMLEPPRAMDIIIRLSELGVRIVIDDFGTGYSSMAYLRKLPIAKIKVDRSFVHDMLGNKNDEVIVRSIIGLGHNLGLNVIAEGVENMATWDQLKSLQCDAAQGYCMARPITAEELERWFRESPHGLKLKKG